ncbi:MAG: mechanosensitive ion channel domain-containing protein [Verrucomicrobiota bacterium]
MDSSRYTLELISALVAVPVLIGVVLGVGRLLRRKFRLPFGLRYKVSASAFAAYLPLRVYQFLVGMQVAAAGKSGAVDVKVDGAASPVLPYEVPESLLQALLAVAIIFAALLSVSLVRKYFWDGWFERTQEMRVPRFVSDIGSVLIVGVALLIVAQWVYRWDLGGLQLGSTVSVAVIGFASQDLLGNLLSGVALQIGSPFKRGDWLMVDGRRLQVLEVNWRATRMRSPDNVLVEVPNKTIAGGVITNLSAPTTERASTVVVAFEQDAAPEEVKACLKKATQDVPGVLKEPAPKVFLKDFGECTIQYEVSFWVAHEESLGDVADAVRTNIWHEMRSRGFKMPSVVRPIQMEQKHLR